MISRQACAITLRAACGSRPPDFAQAASSRSRVLLDSAGRLLMPRWHSAAAPVSAVVVVLAVVEPAPLEDSPELELLLLELPQPAISATVASPSASDVESLRITCAQAIRATSRVPTTVYR